MASILRIVMMALGIYTVLGYLDPESTFSYPNQSVFVGSDEDLPGKLVAYNYGLVYSNYELLWGIRLMIEILHDFIYQNIPKP